MHVRREAWRRPSAVAAPRLLMLLVLVASALVGCSAVGVDAPMSTVQPASDHADEIQSLYKIVFYLAAIVFVMIMVVSVWFTVGFRENGRRQARQFHGNARLEVLWTIIPVVIVIIISVPTFDRIFAIAEEPPADALEVEVIGHQWWFEFRYPDLGITTANEMHVPAGQTVSVSLKSDDVIHSFWVPQLFGKTDVVPGHENHISFTAHEPRAEGYIGQCMELCGLSHANMRFRIFVDSPTDFEAWSRKEAAARVAPSGAAAAGEAAFLKVTPGQACIGCHTVQGTTAAGKIGPNLTHIGGRSTLAAGIMPNTPDNMAKWIRNPLDFKPGVAPPTSMPAHPASALSDQDLQAIVAYLQSLK